MNSKHPGTRLVDLNQSERNRVHQKTPQNASFQCYSATAFSPYRFFFLFNRRVALRMWWISARHPSVGLPADFSHQVLTQYLLTTYIWHNAVNPANKFRVIASEFQCVSFGLPSPSASLVLSRHCSLVLGRDFLPSHLWDVKGCCAFLLGAFLEVSEVCSHSRSGSFSVTPHPKTYWLKNDFITGTSCLGNFCFPGRLIVFPSLSGRRIGLRRQCVFLSIPGFLAGMEGRQVQLGQGVQHLLWSLKHLVL